MLSWFATTALLVRADEFDTLRTNWKTVLTGGTLYSLTDPDFTGKFAVSGVTANWNSMLKTSTRASLWTDLASKADTATIAATYARLRQMATASASAGATGLYQNAALRADIISGMDWLYANWYNENLPALPSVTFSGALGGWASYSWYDLQIGAPLWLNDLMVLLYDDLTPQQITNYSNAIARFLPSIIATDSTSTGANLMWKCKVTALRGVIQKNASLVNHAITQLSNPTSSLFATVTSGDGFYPDGSFVQHTAHAYTGGYGTELISDIADFLFLYQSPPFTVTDPAKANVLTWLRTSFDPVIYKGGVFDSVRGRQVARLSTTSHAAGRSMVSAFLRATQFAPPAEAAYYKSAIKYWLTVDTTFPNRYTNLTVYDQVVAKAIVNDATVTARGDLLGHFHYAGMDRVVHHSPGWASSTSMHSTRIYNYESSSGENLRGWHQGDGMLQIATSDLNHFGNAYWPTTDAQRLPGTTVEAGTTAPQRTKGRSAKVGGVSDSTGRFGLSAMEMAPGGTSALRAKKAWFYSDNKIVCLGAGIAGTGTPTIETIVENRVLSAAGTNALSLNGASVTAPALQAAPATAAVLNNVQYAHLVGNVADGSADMGYYFPSPTTLKAVRETRSGAWRDINSGGSGSAYTTVNTSRFLTLWFDHGVAPTNASYAYAILPTIDPVRLQTYASAPDFSVLENSDAAQAIKDANAGAVGAMFWNASSKTIGTGQDAITANNVAAVYVRTAGSELQVSVADPTQTNTGSITIELGRSAGAVIAKSSTITVTQMSPTIKFTVNVANQAGAAQTIRFTSADVLAPGAIASRLVNLSILTSIDTPGDSFTLGTVVGGGGTSGAKPLLVRAAGPSLGALGVGGTLPDPLLELFYGATKVGENDNWDGATSLSNAFSAVAAFPYASATSKDAAIYNPAVTAGNNSIRVSGVGAATGTVIAELYDSTPTDSYSAATPRLINVSVLKQVGNGFTVGFVVGGAASRRTILVRAIGPGLAAVGVASGFVADPKLDLFAGAARIDGNDDWGGTLTLSNAFAQVGAFAVPASSKDAALLASLAPGSYTVQVSGAAGTGGQVIVEVYEMP